MEQLWSSRGYGVAGCGSADPKIKRCVRGFMNGCLDGWIDVWADGWMKDLVA